MQDNDLQLPAINAAPGNSRLRVLFVAPLPPPFAGPEVATESLLGSSFRDRFELYLIPSRLHDSNRSRGRLKLRSVFRLAVLAARVAYVAVRHRCQVAYLYISQNYAGIARDSVLFLVLRLLGCRVVWHFRGGNLSVFYRNSPRVLRAWIRFLVNHSQAMILLGPSLVPPLRAVGFSAPLHVVPNWGPAPAQDRFPPPRLKIRGSRVTVLALGSISVAKGSADLMRAAEKVLASNANVRFVFAGTCIEEERNILRDESGAPLRLEPIEQRLAGLKQLYPDHIRYVGVAGPQRKWQLLQEADLLVLPSYSEGFPITFLEAMLAGIPIITTPVGAIRDYLTDGENARFVAPGNVEQLANAMLELVNSPQERLRIGSNNYRYVRECLTVEKSAALIANVIENACVA